MLTSKGRILCTEDDRDTREMLTYILTEAGYEVDCTDSPTGALKRAREEHFDLFLIDNWMPDM
ncbi:MAG TPA: response regulator, partial [Candidatus Saccharimonadales bacterium]|nr:response regulator [Candidatus Saccharimonadales bacterium]